MVTQRKDYLSILDILTLGCLFGKDFQMEMLDIQNWSSGARSEQRDKSIKSSVHTDSITHESTNCSLLAKSSLLRFYKIKFC